MKNVAKTEIERVLKKLDVAFRKSSRDQNFFSKLALIELCGWTEVTMDKIILSFAKRKIKNPNNIRFVQDEIIRRNYSFQYDSHFRQMLIKTIGMCQIEKLEKNINQSKKSALESSLSTLKPMRDSHSHCHISGTTAVFFAPSVILRHFNNIYDGLAEIDNYLKN